MKRNLLIVFVLLLSITSCKKEKPPVPEIEERKPEVIIKEITSKLAGADSISTFTSALKNIALTVEETSEGITVFAPLNQNQNSQGRLGRVASVGGTSGKTSVNTISAVGDTTKTSLTESELKDHIVKGVFNFSNLTNGKILTTLNGKELKITRSVDTVWINGVRIGGQQILSSSNEAVFAVKSLLTGTTPTDAPQSTSLEVTVWDATLWTNAKPKGELAANAVVTLYRTQKDYADSIPAFEGRTDATGKVVFKTVIQGDYFIKVSSGAKSNIFNRSTKQDGLYKGFASAGIFQNPAEITAAARQTGAEPGDFKWIDFNGDGVINDSDRITLPYESATVNTGVLKKVEVMIGALKNTQPQPYTETEFNTKLSAVEADVAGWHKKMVLLDGLLGPRVTMDSIPQFFNTPAYQAINNFAFNPSHQHIEEVWRIGYQSIDKLADLQSRVPNTISNGLAKVARIRATKAYVYLQLLTYFGNISLQTTPGSLNNDNNRTSVYNYIISELQSAAGSLSSNVSTSADLNSISVQALIAKAALLEKRYAEVASLTEGIINAGKYTLVAKGSEFTANSKELMWDNSSNMDQFMKSYFYNRASLPYLRLTEVYLMAVEANIALGNLVKAQGFFDVVCNRSGYYISPVTMSNLSGLWGQQFGREGNMFVSTVRWGTASQMSYRGFVEGKHNVLPIPQSVIDANPDMKQNVRY